MAGSDDERTSPVGLFNTARSYWRSAEYLSAARLEVTHPQAPITFLFCHAIELYLKAYLRGTGHDLGQLKQLGHRVASLAQSAIKSGLVIGTEHSEILDHIDDHDVAIEAWYIVTGFKNQPTNEALSNVTVMLDQAICSALAKRGFPVRAEAFTPPTPQRQDDFRDDTINILTYLFKTTDQELRDVSAMAIVIDLERNVLQYHLDRLQEANLAESTGFNYMTGRVYWNLTVEGRRYVVEHKLV
jgi:hypothetical protein